MGSLGCRESELWFELEAGVPGPCVVAPVLACSQEGLRAPGGAARGDSVINSRLGDRRAYQETEPPGTGVGGVGRQFLPIHLLLPFSEVRDGRPPGARPGGVRSAHRVRPGALLAGSG